AGGSSRIASLYLRGLPVGVTVDVRVSDAVGADGRFTIEAVEIGHDMPRVDETTPAIGVSAGPRAWLPVGLGGSDGEGGEVATLLVTIGETDGASLAVTGLGDAQPGVRVWVADASGQPVGEPVFRSSFVPTLERTVELGHLLGTGSYVV